MTWKKVFTLEQRKKLKEYLDRGFDLTTIGGLLNRSYAGFGKEFKRGGGRYNYDPELAHENFLKSSRQSKQSRKQLDFIEMPLENNLPDLSEETQPIEEIQEKPPEIKEVKLFLEERIEILEMQIQILLKKLTEN